MLPKILLIAPPLDVARSLDTVLRARGGGCGCCPNEHEYVSFGYTTYDIVTDFPWPRIVFARESATSVNLGVSSKPWGRYHPDFFVSGYCAKCFDWVVSLISNALPGYMSWRTEPRMSRDEDDDPILSLEVATDSLADLTYLDWAFRSNVELRHEDYYRCPISGIWVDEQLANSLRRFAVSVLQHIGFPAPDDTRDQWYEDFSDTYYDILDRQSYIGKLAIELENLIGFLNRPSQEKGTVVKCRVGEAAVAHKPLQSGSAVSPGGQYWSQYLQAIDVETIHAKLSRIPSVVAGESSIVVHDEPPAWKRLLDPDILNVLVKAACRYRAALESDAVIALAREYSADVHRLVVQDFPQAHELEFESLTGCYPLIESEIFSALQEGTKDLSENQESRTHSVWRPKVTGQVYEAADHKQPASSCKNRVIYCASEANAEYISRVLDRAAPALSKGTSRELVDPEIQDIPREGSHGLHVEINNLEDLDVLNALRNVRRVCERSCSKGYYGRFWFVCTTIGEPYGTYGDACGVFETPGQPSAMVATLSSQCRDCFTELQRRIAIAFPHLTWRLAPQWQPQHNTAESRQVRVYVDHPDTMRAVFEELIDDRESHALRAAFHPMWFSPARDEMLVPEALAQRIASFADRILRCYGLEFPEGDKTSAAYWFEVAESLAPDDECEPGIQDDDPKHVARSFGLEAARLLARPVESRKDDEPVSTDCFTLSENAPIQALPGGVVRAGQAWCIDLHTLNVSHTQLRQKIERAALRVGHTLPRIFDPSSVVVGEPCFYNVSAEFIRTVAALADRYSDLDGTDLLRGLADPLEQRTPLLVVNPTEDTEDQLRAMALVWTLGGEKETVISDYASAVLPLDTWTVPRFASA